MFVIAGGMRGRRRGSLALVALALTAAALGVPLADEAQAATATLNTSVRMSDGVSLEATVTGPAPLSARPVIVEFSPYGPGSGTAPADSNFNYLLVQDRGTGASPGQFDALGPRSQKDVQQTLQWACHQPWSSGNLALNGFSASAIIVYNALHLSLPCVRAAVLKSGTYSLYRDLLYPGGVNNFVPGLGVLALIGYPTLEQGGSRLQPNPLTGLISGFDTAVGFFDVGLDDLGNTTLDSFWAQRQYRGDANHFPIQMLDSFYDVESPGAFEAFRALRGVGDKLLVVAGHDGYPAGTDGGVAQINDWFEHHLLGSDNGAQNGPAVQMLMSDGSRESYDAGDYVQYNASDWPVPGTQWMSLALSPVPSGSGSSINDGSLSSTAPSKSSAQSYAAIPSNPAMSDTANAAFVGQDGLNEAANTFPLLTETNLAEPLALTYTTPPLTEDVLSAGPAALDIRLATTAPSTDIWAVISDVWPDGSSHPVASGRLSSTFPYINKAHSITDSQGQVVGPWGDFTTAVSTPPETPRTYKLAFWPIGNEFKAGDRIRLVILGASGASAPSLPALNTVWLGGASGSKLLLPVLPAQ